MTFTMTLAFPYPWLTGLLWAVTVGAIVKSAILLIKTAVRHKEKFAGRFYGCFAVLYGLMGAALFSVELWQFGVFFGVVAAGCAVLWRRERGRA